MSSSSSSNDRILLNTILKESKKRTPELEESEHFEYFVASEVLKDFELDDRELEAGIVDGGDDGQIDAFYTFAQGQLLEEDSDLEVYRSDVSLDVVIIQAKKKKGFGENELTVMKASLEDLLDLEKAPRELKESYNEPLVRRVEILRKAIRELAGRSPAITFSVYFATVGDSPNNKVKKKAARLEESLESLLSGSKASVVFLGARELLNLARTVPSTMHELKAVETMSAPRGDSLVLFVTLGEFVRFLTAKPRPATDQEDEELDEDNDAEPTRPRINEGLFESNVRAYQGSTTVNSNIRSTLEEGGPEDFWWMNNGISILCSSIEQRGKSFTVRDPQIVNGLQTSREVFDYWTKEGSGRDPEENRHLLVRIIDPEEDLSWNKVIRATNTQNSIPEASLRSTDDMHRDIEDYFKQYQLYYDRRKNFWKNAGKPRADIISIPQLAQAVAAVVLQRPSDARARPSSLLKRNEDYESIFNKQYPLSAYLESIRLMRKVDTFIKTRPGHLPSTERKDLRFHVATASAALHLGKPSPKASMLDYGVFDDLDDETVAEAFKLVEYLVAEQQKSLEGEAADLDRVAKSPALTSELVKKLKAELSGSHARRGSGAGAS